VALIGASDRTGSVRAVVTRNLARGDFRGPLWLVNPAHKTVAAQVCYPDVGALPEAPDLAVVCTPPRAVPGVVAALGARGTHAAVVVTAGLEETSHHGRSLREEMLGAARPHLLRILGHDTVGLLVPGIGLNASCAHANALPGGLAFVSQSGALTTAMLDWSLGQGIGFSHVVSLGHGDDVDCADLLDYLASDPGTRAILLYIEAVEGARKFMSAGRAAARNKPVIVVKSGGSPAGARAAISRTGAQAGANSGTAKGLIPKGLTPAPDERFDSGTVYDAALRRAGMLRVTTTGELFAAAETLARVRNFRGERLAIVSNGRGPGVMALDALIAGGGQPAELAPETVAALDGLLPRAASHGNPVDLGRDAPAERYAAALEPVMRDPNVDALLVIHAPSATVSAEAIARRCVPLLANAPCAVLACWMGASAVAAADAACAEAGLPTYPTSEDAVGGLLHLAAYRRSQEQLMEVPPSLPEGFEPDSRSARTLVAAALADGRDVLTRPESKQVLAAYGILVARTARTVEAPTRMAENSPARTARHGATELFAGIAVDATFGPIVLFGRGGADAGPADRAVALPPLNLKLARELIACVSVSKLLAGDRGGCTTEAIERVLVRLSQLAADIAEIVELDIDPLLADAQGVLALDARIRIAAAAGSGADRFAIRPYPKELEETVEVGGRSVLLRPIRPEDLPRHEAFLARIEAGDMRTRFLHAVRALPPSELKRLTQIDYEREMAFIATGTDPQGDEETLGVVRAHADPDNAAAEFAVLVRSDLKGRGLGGALLRKLVRYCRGRGTGELYGDVLADNVRMLALADELGFRRTSTQDGCVRVVLDLAARTMVDAPGSCA
jgi:acetyltransferase